ncbi:MAG: 1-(5-phosphoribosyl)-5-[(5-phosphoribosylamino)methylideneamino] imidazole-4-carboxamide isomerase [candidate division WOR-3 bacterium]
MEVIPAIDLLGGKSVRLIRGSYEDVIVYGKPIECAKKWVSMGAKRLHIVDLDGAREGRPAHLDTLSEIIRVGVPVQFGGGIRSPEIAEELLMIGIERLIVGTAFWESPDSFAHLREKILPALDIRDGLLVASAWQRGIMNMNEALHLLRKNRMNNAFLTGVSRDGTLAGPDIGLVEKIASEGFTLTIAGGISRLEDLALISRIAGVEAVVVGRALYEGILKEVLPCWPKE